MDRLRTLWHKLLPSHPVGQGCAIRDDGAVPEAKAERAKLETVIDERSKINELVVREFQARLSNDLRRD